MKLQAFGIIGIFSLVIIGGFMYYDIQENTFTINSEYPTELNLKDRTLKINKFFVWRNDMPSLPQNPLRLIFIVEISYVDGFPFDINAKPISFILVNENNDTWGGNFADMDRPDCGINCTEKYASGGPNWEGGTEVFPLVAIEYEKKLFYLKGPVDDVMIAV